MTSRPRYSEAELWDRLRELWTRGDVWKSLVRDKRYTPVDLDGHSLRCRFQYQSGNQIWIQLGILYSLYEELYRVGRLSNLDLSTDSDYCERVTGRPYWHAPGSAMMALLPVLDDRVGYANRELFIASY